MLRDPSSGSAASSTVLAFNADVQPQGLSLALPGRKANKYALNMLRSRTDCAQCQALGRLTMLFYAFGCSAIARVFHLRS